MIRLGWTVFNFHKKVLIYDQHYNVMHHKHRQNDIWALATSSDRIEHVPKIGQKTF